MLLKPRMTYTNGNGNRVCIAGPLTRSIQGKDTPCFWSIQGDHYTQEGLFVFCRGLPTKSDDFILEAFTLEQTTRNIVCEDASEEARTWWDNVKT